MNKEMATPRALPFVLAAALSVMVSACNSAPPTSPNRDSAALRASTLRAGALVASEDAVAHAVRRARVFKGEGAITASVDEFRTALGNLNPNQPGSFGSGRREINWDAVPALFTNTDNFPADFFNQPVVGRARGVVFSTPGSGFRVSDNDFTDLNSTYTEFDFFSPTRTFIAVGSRVTTVDFFVPGSSTPATTTGFGVVFSDIDHPGSGALRFFDAAGRSLGTYIAPASPGGLSFLGVTFPAAIVARVEILSGQEALGAESFDISSGVHGPIRDLAIMDDFLYGEPTVVGSEETESIQ